MIDEQKNQWWRWPLMPFATVFGSCLGAVVFTSLHWLSMKFQGGFSEDGWMYIYILPLLSSGTFGFLWSYISYTVAPTGKLVASTIMVTILCILGTLLVAFSVFVSKLESGDKAMTIFQVAIIAVAAIVTLYQLHRDSK